MTKFIAPFRRVATTTLVIRLGLLLPFASMSVEAQSCTNTNWSPALVTLALQEAPLNLTTVVAHRGAWIGLPENSAQAVAETGVLGIEAAEIDIRETSDRVPIAEHDWALGRTMSIGGSVYDTSSGSITAALLKYRDSRTVSPSYHPALISNILGAAIANNVAIVLDIKSQGTAPGPSPALTSYQVLQDVYRAEVAYATANQLELPYVMSFVTHKVLWRELPSLAQMQTDMFNGESVPDYFHLIGVEYPNDSVDNEYYSQLFFRVEPGVNAPQAPLEGQKNSLLSSGVAVGAFSDVYDWPEGRSKVTGQCCEPTNSNVSSNPTSDQVDYRGDLNFVVGYMKSTAITTDRPQNAVFYLEGLGQRNTNPYCSISLDQSSDYKIMNVNSNLLLGVSGESMYSGANIVQYSDNGTLDHIWSIANDPRFPAAWNIYTIANANSTLFLSAPAYSNQPGGSVTQEPAINLATRWAITDAGNGMVQIRNLYTGQLLGVLQESTSLGAQIVQYPDNGTPDHLWKLVSQ